MKVIFLLSALFASIHGQTIVDLAVGTPELSTLVSVLSPDIVAALQGDGPFTVFAPTNDAFAAAGLIDAAALTDVLLYHVISGAAVKSGDLASSQAPTMLNGARAVVKKSADGVTISGANVVLADVMASNGVVHVIDKVILPPSESVVGLAVATPAVSTLVSVLTMPEYKPILDALSGDGPFTVFAPTNDAFAKAGVDPSDVDTVSDVLKYHVLSGAVFSDDLQASQDVATLNGAKVSVKKSTGVTVNNANVIVADVAGTNGVVHVIDSVLLPPSTGAIEIMTTTQTMTAPVSTTASNTPSRFINGAVPHGTMRYPQAAYNSYAASTTPAYGYGALPYGRSAFGAYSTYSAPSYSYGSYGGYGGYGGYGYGSVGGLYGSAYGRGAYSGYGIGAYTGAGAYGGYGLGGYGGYGYGGYGGNGFWG